MNYTKIYKQITERAKHRKLEDYTEKHHILPKSLGGNDKKENIVELTAREHFICHWLLTKFTKGDDRVKMLQALNMMKVYHNGHNRYINSKVFERVKNELYGENGLLVGGNHYWYGREHTDETKEKQRQIRTEYLKNHPEELERMKQMALNRSKDHQEKINESNRGQKRSKESRKKMSESHIGLQTGCKNGMSKQVYVEGKIYDSVGLALKETNLKRGTLYFRVNSPNYTDYYYI